MTADLKKEGDSFMESKKRFALLDLLLYSKIVEQVDLSEDDIREEVDTFMFEVRRAHARVRICMCVCVRVCVCKCVRVYVIYLYIQ